MPLVRIVTSSATASGKTDALLQELSRLLAKELGKPEGYVMTCLDPPPARMTFGGTFDPACYVEVKNVGAFGPDLTNRMSAALTDRLAAALGVPRERIYIEFADARPHMWGYDGGTFG